MSSSAVAAKSTADKALSKAIKANKKAKAAQDAANQAQTTADLAKTAADSAQAAANAAQTTANSKYGSVTFQDETRHPERPDRQGPGEHLPLGKRSVGGGYILGGGTNAAYVNINEPYGSTAWIVQAQDNPSVASNWTLSVAVNCIGS